MTRIEGATDKKPSGFMPRTPQVIRLKVLVIQNPGLTVGQLAVRLGTSCKNLHSLLVQAEAQSLLLAQSQQRPAGICFFWDIAE
jgi:hypothetical protein